MTLSVNSLSDTYVMFIDNPYSAQDAITLRRKRKSMKHLIQYPIPFWLGHLVHSYEGGQLHLLPFAQALFNCLNRVYITTVRSIHITSCRITNHGETINASEEKRSIEAEYKRRPLEMIHGGRLSVVTHGPSTGSLSRGALRVSHAG